MSEAEAIASNQANWDDRADIHVWSQMYDAEGRIAGVDGHGITWVEGDARHAASLIDRRFDVVVTSAGTIVWLPELLDAGLTIETLAELPHMDWPAFAELTPCDQGWALPEGSPRIPLTFAVVARRL